MHYTAKVRKTPPPQPVLFKLFDEEPGGVLPEAFVEPRPQKRTHNTQHITTHRVQTHSFSRFEQIVLVILFHEIATSSIPGRELESSKHRRARARRSLARNWLRAAKSGWLTLSGKRRTSRALRLLRRHHRSEAPCMAPKQSTRPRTAAQPNEAEKKVQCGTCSNDS